MKGRLVWLCCLFCLLAVAPIAGAQEGADKGPAPVLTLEDAVRLALAQNYQIAASELGAEAAKWQQAVSITTWLPKADFVTTYTRQDPETVDRANQGANEVLEFFDDLGLGGGISTITDETYSSRLVVTQPITNGGAEIAGILGATADRKAREAELADTILRTAQSVKRAYFESLKAHWLVLTADEAKVLSDEALRLSRTRFELGEAARPELLRFEAESARVEGERIAAEIAEDVAMLSLYNLIGEDLNSRYRLPEFVRPASASVFEGQLRAAGVLEEDQTALTRILREHPSLIRLDALVDGAKAGRAEAWSQILPRMNFVWTYSWPTDDDIALDEQQSWTAAITLQVPLFRSLGGAFGIVNRRKVYAQTVVAREDAERGLLQQALVSQRTLSATYQRLLAAEKQLSFADENLRVLRAQMEVGRSSYLETLDSQLNYVAARSGYITSVADFLIAMAEWDYLHAREEGALLN